jgi:NADPH:quinone reductase-like Zn-dependent oxidoreductase
MDFAGKVKEVGEGVETGIKVGDDVMGMVMPNGTHGAYSDQLILNQFAVVRMPKDVSYIEASTLPMNGLTARLSLGFIKFKQRSNYCSNRRSRGLWRLCYPTS